MSRGSWLLVLLTMALAAPAAAHHYVDIETDEDAEGVVAISIAGDANGNLAASGTGNASGQPDICYALPPLWTCWPPAGAVSGTGDATSCRFITCFAASGGGDSWGRTAVSGGGSAGGGVAVAGVGAADGSYAAATVLGDATSQLAAVSGTGNASVPSDCGSIWQTVPVPCVSISGTGHAHGAHGVSGCDLAGACVDPKTLLP